MHDYFLGVDVGGTKSEVCLLALERSTDFHSYKIVARERMSTHRTGTLDEFLVKLHQLINSVLTAQKLKIEEMKGIGIGLPGSINPLSQQMVAGSIPFFLNVPLIAPFRRALNYSGTIVFDNDANCFALAEAYLGAGASWAKKNKVPMEELCMIGVILGTGVGGGLIVKGELVRGRRGGAGEIGHMCLIESGLPCYCGKFGCSEQYLSGTAFENSYAMRVGDKTLAKGNEIFKKVDEQDPVALATLEHYKDHMVSFFSNLCNFLDPHVIVLGGGMSTQSKIYEGIHERLSKECFLTANPPDVLSYECGDSAGVFGAALLSFSATKAHRIGPEGLT